MNFIFDDNQQLTKSKQQVSCNTLIKSTTTTEERVCFDTIQRKMRDY